MIKNLIETFNLIRDDPYLSHILSNPRYLLTTTTFIGPERIRIEPGVPARVFPTAIDIKFTEGNKKLLISLPYDSYTCKITEETFNRLIDPELFIECVNTLFEYKDFFRSEGIAGMPGKAAVL